MIRPFDPRRLAAALKPADARKHTRFEDAVAFCIAVVLIGFGLALLQAAGLATGGVAGIALILHFATSWPAGLLFLLVNAPFYALVFRTMGREFGLKTLIVNPMLAGFGALAPHAFAIEVRSEPFAAVAGGVLLGMGVLALARHRASVGGFSALAIYLQERGVMRAGLAQALTDCFVIACAAAVLDPRHVALSVLSAVVLSIVLVLNHKPGRYSGF
ncbi:YitT family protein [Methylopila turkensis]|nr:YitT family protein [Methylopila turkensis]